MLHQRRSRAERIGMFALAGLVSLILAYLLTAESAPAIRVRWQDDLSSQRQTELERTYLLVDAGGSHEDAPTSFAYALLDTSRRNIAALVNDAAVADTHYLNRDSYTVAPDAPGSERRIWLAHRLPGLQRTAAQWLLLAALTAATIAGFRVRLAAWVGAALARTFGADAAVRIIGRRARAQAAQAPAAAMRGLAHVPQLPLIRDWRAPASGQDRDWFDAWPARLTPPLPPHRLSAVAKLAVSAAMLVAIGVPVLATWKVFLLTSCLMGLVFGTWRPQVWRVGVAAAIAVATVAIKSELPRADIAEGRGIL